MEAYSSPRPTNHARKSTRDVLQYPSVVVRYPNTDNGAAMACFCGRSILERDGALTVEEASDVLIGWKEGLISRRQSHRGASPSIHVSFEN